MPAPDARELQALGVYDPASPHAEQTLELIAYLLELGASSDDLVDFREELSGLPSVLAMRSGRPLTLEQAVERSGIAEDKLLRLSRAAGFPDPGPDDRVFDPRFADLASGMQAAEGVFGEDAVLALVRVMGSTMATLADAIVSAFLVNVEPESSAEEDPVRLDVARANARAGELLPIVGVALDILLRQHLLAARRSSLGLAAESGFEQRQLSVGFVDLVGSTALVLGSSAGALGRLLSEFERICGETVAAEGGRVVKLIGDAVLFTAPDEARAAAIALRLAAEFAEHPTIPAIRAGLAGGEVMLRDGDVFGPTVNLSARVVGIAGAGEVLAPRAFAAAAALPSQPLAPRQLKGFREPVELCVLSPTGSGR